jgi:hypothetical protein
MLEGCASFRSLNRREVFPLFGAGLFGLTLADFFRAEASPGKRSAPARQVLLLFLRGGPPHQDTFDLKPDRPEDIRGPFKPIKTVVPGLDICEHLPQTASVTNRFSILRSVHSRGYPEAGGHHAGLSWKTGNPRGLRGTPKYPIFGSVTSKLLPTPKGLPGFLSLGDINAHAPGLRENYLGPAHDPLSISDDRRYDFTLPMLTPSLEVADFERNAELVKALDDQNRLNDSLTPLIAGLDHNRQKAFDLLRSPKLREALDLSKESAKTQERYGCRLKDYRSPSIKGNLDCQKVLVARRLIEAGVPFVYLDFAYWDWHNGNGLDKAIPHLQSFDHAVPALLTDLAERGLLDTTLVLAFGEMGRTPKANLAKYGREHWAPAQFVLMAGGGTRPGQVVGATDRDGAYVKDREYRIGSLGKTIYHLLGIDPNHELPGSDGRPLKLITEDVPLIKEVL